jgi:hypothetical protein
MKRGGVKIKNKNKRIKISFRSHDLQIFSTTSFLSAFIAPIYLLGGLRSGFAPLGTF